jgi:hypothetical protein
MGVLSCLVHGSACMIPSFHEILCTGITIITWNLFLQKTFSILSFFVYESPMLSSHLVRKWLISFLVWWFSCNTAHSYLVLSYLGSFPIGCFHVGKSFPVGSLHSVGHLLLALWKKGFFVEELFLNVAITAAWISPFLTSLSWSPFRNASFHILKPVLGKSYVCGVSFWYKYLV